MATVRTIGAVDAPRASGGYAQAVEVSGGARTLDVSGQVPLDAQERLAPMFGDQCEQAGANVAAQLRAADMTLDNLVKVTTFLADRRHADENRAVRQEVLGDRSPAPTVVIAGLFDPAWLVEIEAVAVA